MSYNVSDIAKKILAKASESVFDELISNLKLQKLLYYMQGFHLAYFDSPLFEEEIEAWMYGPVVPIIYEEYKQYGNAGIPCSSSIITLTDEEESLFREVYKVYNAYSAIGLMNLTHSETPWNSVAKGVGSIISKSALKEYFKKRIE